MNEEPTEKDNNKLDIILRKLEKMEKQRKREREDRYFFALVFALALFFITFPSVADFTSFFQSLGATLQIASDTALFLKGVLILGFVVSSGARYYGAINENEKWKYLSLESLVSVFLLLVFGAILNGLGSLEIATESTVAYDMLLWGVLLVCVYLVGWFERWMVRFYLEIGHFTSASYFPVLHVVFMALPLWVLSLVFIAQIFEALLVIAHIQSPLHWAIGILGLVLVIAVPLIITALILLKYIERLERKLETKFLSVFGVRDNR